eukprot:TRINITY_DN91765_c0_g1_i1.p1 TRINITY_DN91765_c0_g1~~TRINITY_DN91765_c0_g1_i1.p1  ORF type:complete len:733 (+),score=128.49 TRINITY_DN91765_c0_g1_i1:137-2335(+)
MDSSAFREAVPQANRAHPQTVLTGSSASASSSMPHAPRQAFRQCGERLPLIPVPLRAPAKQSFAAPATVTAGRHTSSSSSAAPVRGGLGASMPLLATGLRRGDASPSSEGRRSEASSTRSAPAEAGGRPRSKRVDSEQPQETVRTSSTEDEAARQVMLQKMERMRRLREYHLRGFEANIQAEEWRREEDARNTTPEEESPTRQLSEDRRRPFPRGYARPPTPMPMDRGRALTPTRSSSDDSGALDFAQAAPARWPPQQATLGRTYPKAKRSALKPKPAAPKSTPTAKASVAGKKKEHRAESSDEEICWICHDTGTSTKALVRPCQCRGSMGGVHVKCVEMWVRTQAVQHHSAGHGWRETMGRDWHPRCPVCHSPFCGAIEAPALHEFALHISKIIMDVATRSSVLFLLCFAFLGPPEVIYPFQCAVPVELFQVLAMVLALGSVNNAAVMTASLPPGPASGQPRTAMYLRRVFHTSSVRRLERHATQTLAALLAFVGLAVRGNFWLPWLIPLLGAFSIPFYKCMRQITWSRSSCSDAFTTVTRTVPFLLWRSVVRTCRRALHPLNAGPHSFCALVSVFLVLVSDLCWVTLLFWTMHSFFLITGMFEAVWARRLGWRRGRQWFVASADAFAVYLNVGTTRFSCDSYDEECFSKVRLIGAAAFVWFSLVLSLSMSLNIEQCCTHYRSWKRRHGVFRLTVPKDVPSRQGSTSADDFLARALQATDDHYVRLPGGPA